LAIAVCLFALSPWRDDTYETLGMVAQPCEPDGRSITERPIDDWPGRCFYATTNAQLLASEARPEVVMIGDSLTEEWPNEGISVAMRGIGGQTSAQLLVRFRQDVVDLEPKIVHILVGTNDIAGNTGPISPAMLMSNIAAMADIADANGINVVIATIPPAEKFPWRHRVDPGDWVREVNGLLTAFASERDFVLADYHAVLANSDGSIRKDFFTDGAHVSEAGYVAIRQVFHDALARARATSEFKQ